MKNSFISALLAAVVLLSTSCIKNEESEGVKSMRTSQASLLSAMAAATTTAATADAALKAAQAALTTAQADIQKNESAAKVQQMTIANANATENNRHQAALNTLNESLQAATDAKTKASLTLRIAEEAANSAYNLKVIANDQTMLDAQIVANKNQNDIAIINAKLALAQAQTAYNLGIQRDALTFSEQQQQMKNQVQGDLLNGYNNAYYNWSNETQTINSINWQIASGTIQLSNPALADSSNVNNAKRQLDAVNKILAQRKSDLTNAKAAGNAGINQLIANDSTELKALTAANVLLNNQKATENANLQNLSYAISKTSQLLNVASAAENMAYRNVTLGQSNINAAFAADTLATSTQPYYYQYLDGTYTSLQIGYTHYRNGGFVNMVALQNAVAAEKSDTTAKGQYLSIQDQTEAITAQEKDDAAKVLIAKAKSDYTKLYSTWLTAHNAATTANTNFKAAVTAYRTAFDAINNNPNSATYQYNNNQYRIYDLQSMISTLLSQNGSNLVPNIQSQIDQLTLIVKSDQAMYNNALESLNMQIAMNQSNTSDLQTSLDNLKISLANEQAKLVLYKATLDEWVVKIKAALPKN